MLLANNCPLLSVGSIYKFLRLCYNGKNYVRMYMRASRV